MFRIRTFIAVLCTSALAACAEAITDTGREKTASAADPEPGVCGRQGAPAGSGSAAGGQNGNACDGNPSEPSQPSQPAEPPSTSPLFEVPRASITPSTSAGVTTVNLDVSADFTYATVGRLTVVFKRGTGCNPVEFSRSEVVGNNAPFTLRASRSETHDAASTVSWSIQATAYAESPEGGSAWKTTSTTRCG